MTKALRARSGDVASWILDRNARFYIAGMRKWPPAWRWRCVIAPAQRWWRKGGGAVAEVGDGGGGFATARFWKAVWSLWL